MPLVLHLSDLHLVDPRLSPTLGDQKTPLVRRGDRESWHVVLQRTFTQLAERLAKEQKHLDAVIVCGDVAERNDASGYEAFLELVNSLGDAMPPASRIVVVPGNHDVERGLNPGAPDRYAKFIAAVRGAGFITPRLDGVDIGARADDCGAHIVRIGNVEIVPFNTSAYAQVRLELGVDDEEWKRAVEAIKGAAGDSLAALIERLVVVDAARVSERHLTDVERLIIASAEGAGPPAMRIAVLHHQLLPVSAEEEIKAFEAFTNLGLFREFLAKHEFAMVLHGHKHAPLVYTDYFAQGRTGDGVPRRLLVVAGPGPGPATTSGAVGNLLDIDPLGGVVLVQPLMAVSLGTPRVSQSSRHIVDPIGAAEVNLGNAVLTIEGETVADVYPRLLAVMSGDSAAYRGAVITRVRRSPDDGELAALYPGFNREVGQGAEPEFHAPGASATEQFSELVEWWQERVVLNGEDGAGFSHGNRIFRYDGYLDQVKGVVAALARNPRSTRGVVSLLNPGADQSDGSGPFPSFCLLQFGIVSPPDGGTVSLECTAYFRKQEMRYWWLVNLAEVASLQAKVAEGLRASSSDAHGWVARATPGPIRTIAVSAHVGNVPPKVQIPRVDQLYFRQREVLSDMVHAVFWPGVPRRQELAGEWGVLIGSLVPPAHPDPDGTAVAVHGLRYLVERVRAHVADKAGKERERVDALVNALDKLRGENELYAHKQALGQVTYDVHASWRDACRTAVAKVLELTYNTILTERP